MQADVDNVGSDFDLNSLIEGDVDDDEYGEENREEPKTPAGNMRSIPDGGNPHKSLKRRLTT